MLTVLLLPATYIIHNCYCRMATQLRMQLNSWLHVAASSQCCSCSKNVCGSRSTTLPSLSLHRVQQMPSNSCCIIILCSIWSTRLNCGLCMVCSRGCSGWSQPLAKVLSLLTSVSKCCSNLSVYLSVCACMLHNFSIIIGVALWLLFLAM